MADPSSKSKAPVGFAVGRGSSRWRYVCLGERPGAGGAEQRPVCTGGDRLAQFVRVAGLFEQERVAIVGDARARVSELALHADDVETLLDDQVRGEGAAEDVRAHSFDAGRGGDLAQEAIGLAVVKRLAIPAFQHEVIVQRVCARAAMFAQEPGKLGDEDDVALGVHLERCEEGRTTSARSLQLPSQPNESLLEVDVCPAQSQEFSLAYAGEKEGGRMSRSPWIFVTAVPV